MIKLVVCLLALACLCNCQSSWVGTWSDSEFGGDIFICVSGSTVNFAFSKVGIAVGTISNDGTKISGTIYVGGGDTLDHSSKGTFELTLANNEDSFSGSYSWDDENQGKVSKI